MILNDWLAKLERLHPVGIDLGLERIAQVAQRCLPNVLPMRVITVGGTNGKGSVCAFLEACLLASGYRVGLYTSPHLLRFNERVRIQGQDVADDDLIEALSVVEQARDDISLTYFEFTTLAAMWLYCRAKLDVLVLEVGLGGRLDAVNLFDADCAVITSVDIDHVAYLGDNREQIGREKAGIYRTDRPAICADPHPPNSLLLYGQSIGAQQWQVGKEYGYAIAEYDRDVWWRYHDRWGELVLPRPTLGGVFQIGNAAAAVAALRALGDKLPVELTALQQGLINAGLRGRYQCLGDAPERRVDVAHNPHGARALAASLRQSPAVGHTWGVCAMLMDKDAAGVVAAMVDVVDHWVVAGLPGERGGTGAGLAQQIRVTAGKIAVECVTVLDAWQLACQQAGENDRIVAFGSFLTVADILQYEGEN